MTTEFVNIDEEGLLQKQILKDGVGDCPESFREVFVFFVLRGADGNILGASESQPFKIVVGRNDSFAFLEKTITTMKLGERALVKVDQSLVNKEKRLVSLLGGASANVELEVEIVRLGNYANALWELETNDREKTAAAAKVQGNEFIKEKQYANAVSRYETGLKTMTNDSNQTFIELKQSLQNNLSLAYLKNAQYPQCVYTATQALLDQPTNLKLLYRRAQAHAGAGDYDKAKEDLKMGLTVEPENQEFNKELTQILVKEKAQFEKEKKVYTNMFK